MKKEILLSVAVLHYNRIRELLVSLNKTRNYLQRTFPPGSWEIIVVDNASSQQIPDLGNDVRLIKLDKNIGLPALNSAFSQASGKYVLELDDDSYPEFGLDEAVSYLKNNPHVGILGLKINGPPNPINSVKHLQELTGFVGCGVLFNKEMLKRTGGYSPWIFIYANEHDLSMHSYMHGYKTLFFSKASVFHMTAPSHRTSERLLYNSAKNYTISYKLYFNGLIGFVRTLLLQLLILLQLPKDKFLLSNIKFTLKGFRDGIIEAEKLPKRYLPLNDQLQIFFRVFKLW